jgi:hypothetical protein
LARWLWDSSSADSRWSRERRVPLCVRVDSSCANAFLKAGLLLRISCTRLVNRGVTRITSARILVVLTLPFIHLRCIPGCAALPSSRSPGFIKLFVFWVLTPPSIEGNPAEVGSASLGPVLPRQRPRIRVSTSQTPLRQQSSVSVDITPLAASHPMPLRCPSISPLHKAAPPAHR